MLGHSKWTLLDQLGRLPVGERSATSNLEEVIIPRCNPRHQKRDMKPINLSGRTVHELCSLA